MSKIVIKVGSNLLVDRNGAINKKYIIELAGKIAELYAQNNKVVLVSSGARASGYGYLKYQSNQESELYMKQALCAVGQVQLMKLYETAFDFYGLKIAQLLLTRDVFNNRKRFLNLRNTLIGLLEMGIVPIVNENDTVATDEIMFGDNDILASMFAIGWNADFLVLLTSVNGLMSDDGNIIENFNENIKLKSLSKTNWGSGGISTKIEAAKKASKAGVKVCICNGRNLENIISFVKNGKPLMGTIFEIKNSKHLKARKAWIGLLSKSKGRVYINSGAEQAIMNGKSLLPVGITEIEGVFKAGDVVEILNEKKKVLGRGISNFADFEAKKIIGLKNEELKKVLGYEGSKVFIHRDNMWLEDMNHQ